MEVFAGFLSHTDHHIGRLLDFLEEIGELDNTLIMVISDNGASAEGGPTGTTNETQFFNNAPGAAGGQPRRRSTSSAGPTTFNHYPWGWTWAGNTPFRRWKRETYRGGTSDPFIVHWPKGIQARGEIRTQYAHVIDMVPDRARRARDRAAGHDPRGHAVADRGRQLRPHLRRRRRGDRAPDAVLRDVRPPRDLPRRLARGLPLARALVHRGRQAASGRPIPAEDAQPTWTPTAGSSTTSPRTSPRTTTSPTEHRDKLIEMIAQWYVEAGKYNVLPDRRQRPAAADDRTPADRRGPRPATPSGPGTQTVPSSPSPRGCSTARTASPPTSRSRPAAPRASCSARAPAPAATPSTSRTAGCTTSTTTSAAPSTASSSAEPVPEGRHELRFEFEPTGSPTSPTARAHPDGPSSTSTATWSAETDMPVTTPIAFNPGGLTCGANPGSPVTPDYQVAVPLHRHPAHGHRRRQRRPHHRHRSEMRMAMARQ